MKEINKSNYTTFDDLWNESSLTEEEKDKINKKVKKYKDIEKHKQKKEANNNDDSKN